MMKANEIIKDVWMRHAIEKLEASNVKPRLGIIIMTTHGWRRPTLWEAISYYLFGKDTILK